ncbi:hypothetical protein N665_1268s0004 [Sinapis alba]|nr:hypothetical protein N665_1268s0004 [Sinapis alba]
MALNSVSSEDFSFPLLASQDCSQISGTDSPPLWKHSPENIHRGDHDRGFGRLIIGSYDDDDQRKSFSYVERRSLWNVNAEEKMDILWEYLNEELPPRSQSLRIRPGGGEKKSSLFPDESFAVECGMKLAKKTPQRKKKKIGTNVLELMRALKKILLMRSLSLRSPAKTHPR